MSKKCVISPCVKQYVKKAIHQNVENKQASFTQSFSFGSVVNDPNLYTRPLTPGVGLLTIPQGTGQGDRIGNKIRVMKAMLRFTLNANPYDLNANPLPTPAEVCIWIGYLKSVPTVAPSSATLSNFFQSGSFVSGFAGDIRDLIKPINKDFFTVKKVLRFKIGTSMSDGTGSQVSRQYLANNDYKFNVCRNVDITSIYPASLRYADTSTGAQNAGLFMWMQSMSADGTATTINVTPTRINWTIDLTYEDA